VGRFSNQIRVALEHTSIFGGFISLFLSQQMSFAVLDSLYVGWDRSGQEKIQQSLFPPSGNTLFPKPPLYPFF